MTLSQRDRRALILGGCGLGLIAGYLVIVEPLAKTYGGLVAEHDRLAARIARTIYDSRKADYFAGLIEEHEQSAGELAAPKPYDEQITTIGEQVTTAAQTSGIKLRGTTPTAAVPWGDDPALELALLHIDAEVQWENVMTAGRGWENVFKFIASLYRVPGVLSVERLELTTEQKKGQADDPNRGGKMTVRLTVSVLAAPTPSGPRASASTPQSENRWPS